MSLLDTIERSAQRDDIFDQRVLTLIEELEKYGDDGAIFMNEWLHYKARASTDEEAARMIANPCGTAACIAGKAGLMQVFREQGFRVDPKTGALSIHPSDFFGHYVYTAVFTGAWSTLSIHTPAQAVLVLRAFLDQKEATEEMEWAQAFDTRWAPPDDVVQRVLAAAPSEKVFAVSGLVQTDFAPGCQSGVEAEMRLYCAGAPTFRPLSAKVGETGGN